MLWFISVINKNMKQNSYSKFIFLNQTTGPLFRELAEDISRVWPHSTLFTGNNDLNNKIEYENLSVKTAPVYDRRNYLTRSYSWALYFFRALLFVWLNPKDSILFIVSNPPFLGLVGLLFKLIRGQRYVVLVYDIYPDLLIQLNRLKPGIISRCWDLLNRLIYNNSILVITIDKDMAERLSKKFGGYAKDHKTVVCIPPWADVDRIVPVEKENNPFVKVHKLSGKSIILYSGNIGHTHDIETLLEAAKVLRNEDGIHFLFIGAGAKREIVEKAINDYHLENMSLLPFQPEEVLPFSISSGDVGIVTYGNGTQGCMVPSKAFYYLAAGLPILVISEHETDLSKFIKENDCGVRVKNGDISSMVRTIKILYENHELLSQYKKSARSVAVRYFSRKNTDIFIKELRAII
jgi:glycosyltransferase involved in cell wall biosynthesis